MEVGIINKIIKGTETTAVAGLNVVVAKAIHYKAADVSGRTGKDAVIDSN